MISCLQAMRAVSLRLSLGLASASAGAVLVDQYCNPLSDVSLSSISGQLDEIVEKVRKMLSIKNPSHPSLSVAQGEKAATRSRCWSASAPSDSLESDADLLAFPMDRDLAMMVMMVMTRCFGLVMYRMFSMLAVCVM